MNLTVDSSVWVAAMFPQEAGHEDALNFVKDVLAGIHQAALPVSILTEVVCAAARRNKQYGIDRRVAIGWGLKLKSSPYIFWKTVDLSFAHEAALCGAKYQLRGMDALIAATALFYSIPLVSDDKEFKRLGPERYVFQTNEMFKFGN